MARSTTTIRSTLRSISCAALLCVGALCTPAALAARRAHEALQLFVTQPFLELHTGPGRGFPVAQVVGRGESVDVLKRQTEWFKVRTERGIEGWAWEGDLGKSVQADGKPFLFNRGDRAGYTSHHWESGFMLGSYGGATLVSAYEARSLTDHLKVELAVGQFLGNLSNGYIADLGLSHVVMPEWRLSPFITLGGGLEHLTPKAVLASPLDRNDQTAYVGAGLRYYWARRFFLRAEYRDHTIFTSRDSNEVRQEWKLGFAFFY